MFKNVITIKYILLESTKKRMIVAILRLISIIELGM